MKKQKQFLVKDDVKVDPNINVNSEKEIQCNTSKMHGNTQKK